MLNWRYEEKFEIIIIKEIIKELKVNKNVGLIG